MEPAPGHASVNAPAHWAAPNIRLKPTLTGRLILFPLARLALVLKRAASLCWRLWTVIDDRFPAWVKDDGPRH